MNKLNTIGQNNVTAPCLYESNNCLWIVVDSCCQKYHNFHIRSNFSSCNKKRQNSQINSYLNICMIWTVVYIKDLYKRIRDQLNSHIQETIWHLVVTDVSQVQLVWFKVPYVISEMVFQSSDFDSLDFCARGSYIFFAHTQKVHPYSFINQSTCPANKFNLFT